MSRKISKIAIFGSVLSTEIQMLAKNGCFGSIRTKAASILPPDGLISILLTGAEPSGIVIWNVASEKISGW